MGPDMPNNASIVIPFDDLSRARDPPQQAPSAFEFNEGDHEVPLNAVSLPPVDGGFDAYAYLGAAFILELLVWSYPFSYGVFLSYYTSHLFPNSPDAHLLPLVGTLSSGIIYLSSVVVFPLIQRYPHHMKSLMRSGLFLCVVGLVGAAFSTKPWHLVLTQGVIYSIGGSILYFPVMPLMLEWFVARRGLANGLVFSGTGLGGVVVPFISEVLLRRFGHRTTFISMALAFLALILPSLPFIKSRLPPTHIRAVKSVDWRFCRSLPFWILFLSNFLQGLANFLPGLYLSSFAVDLQLSSTASTLILSLLNGASVPGLILLGYASDRHDLRLSILVSTLGSGLAVLLLWGFAKGLAPLVIFSLIFGALAGGFSALWPRFVSFIAKEDNHLQSTLLSIFIAGRGVGNVLSAPISAGLLSHQMLSGSRDFGYGLKGYGSLILFTGVALLGSTVGIVYKSVGKTVTEIREADRRGDSM